MLPGRFCLVVHKHVMTLLATAVDPHKINGTFCIKAEAAKRGKGLFQTVSRRFILTAGASALMLAPFAQGAAAFPRMPTPARVEAGQRMIFRFSRFRPRRSPNRSSWRKKVRLVTNEKPGTIIVDTNTKYLYYVEGNNRATRYGVGVGREGFGWSGTVKVGRKAEWPDWRPPAP
jgi:lipoprotein-anchoring transpeptidase ErfK/SrfK